MFIAVFLYGCTHDDENIIQFERVLYSIYEGGSTTISVITNKPVEKDLDVELQFSNSMEGKITICKGKSKGQISISNTKSEENKPIIIDIITPSGYIKGTKYRSYLVSESEEAIVCSFKYKDATLLEKYIAEVSITGAVSGKDFSTLKDIEIPIKLTGEDANLISLDNHFVTIPAGETKGLVTLNIAKVNYHGGFKSCNLEIDTNSDTRILVGDNGHMKINICGVQIPQALIGEWEYEFVYDKDELMMWFEEMEDDPNELPLHNEDFKLTFTEKEGKVLLIPSGSGDYLNYFRESKIVLTEPINYPPGTILLGKYSTDESNMFMEDAGFPRQQNTYYKLSKANRSFSADNENIGESVIVFSLRSDGGLDMQFRDYDEPPFGFMWWDSKFDASMFGFATSFRKASTSRVSRHKIENKNKGLK